MNDVLAEQGIYERFVDWHADCILKKHHGGEHQEKFFWNSSGLA